MREIHYLTILAILFAALVIFSALKPAHGQEQEPPKGFDYYLLSMSWSPEFCQTHDFTQECKEHHRFILHGLWPQYEDGGYPNHCKGERVPDAVVEDMMSVMPNRHLIIHEWQKHGTCSSLKPSVFFQNAKDIYNNIVIPDIFKKMTKDLDTNPESVINAFMAVNPGLEAKDMEVVCHEDQLSEVRFCVNKEGKSRECGPLTDTCRAKYLTILAPASEGGE